MEATDKLSIPHRAPSRYIHQRYWPLQIYKNYHSFLAKNETHDTKKKRKKGEIQEAVLIIVEYLPSHNTDVYFLRSSLSAVTFLSLHIYVIISHIFSPCFYASSHQRL